MKINGFFSSSLLLIYMIHLLLQGFKWCRRANYRNNRNCLLWSCSFKAHILSFKNTCLHCIRLVLKHWAASQMCSQSLRWEQIYILITWFVVSSGCLLFKSVWNTTLIKTQHSLRRKNYEYLERKWNVSDGDALRSFFICFYWLCKHSKNIMLWGKRIMWRYFLLTP